MYLKFWHPKLTSDMAFNPAVDLPKKEKII